MTTRTNGGSYMKKGTTRTYKLVGCFGKSAKKKSQNLGDFFVDKSLDFGSTCSRGFLIFIITACVYM